MKEENAIEIKIEKAKLEELKKELAYYEEAKYTSKITAIRGRIIKRLKTILNLYEKIEYRTEDEQKDYEKYETELSENIFRHKINLKERYSNEFIKGEAKVPDVITTFPKGVMLQVQKVANAINEIKTAKNSKAKVSAVTNLAKEIGLLAATPVIFAGKFVIEHWYLILLLWQGNKLGWFKGKNNSNENSKPELQGQEQEAYETVTEAEHAIENAGDNETVSILENEQDGVVVNSPSVSNIQRNAELDAQHAGEQQQNAIDHAAYINQNEVASSSESLRNIERNAELDAQHAGEQQQNAIDHAAYINQNEVASSSESLRNIERNAELDAQHAGEQQQNAIDHAAYINQNEVASTIPQENLFSAEEQKDLLYKIAIKSYEHDSIGNSFDVYRNFDDYVSTLGELSPEEIENIKNMIYSDSGISIRFIVDDKGLGFYNSEEEFINSITRGVGLVDIDTSTQSFQDYLNGLGDVGNPLNLIGTEFDQSGLNLLEQMTISEQVQEFMAVSGSVGAAAFILYQALKYGLAIPTHGLSLMAP